LKFKDILSQCLTNFPKNYKPRLILVFGLLSSVLCFLDDVSEHHVGSILSSIKKVDLIRCSETSSKKLDTLGNNPKTTINPTDHGESLKSRSMNHLKMLSARRMV
jgi:hypothetical protein